MPKEKSKATPIELPVDLSEIILDYAKEKYSLIPLISVWARHLRGLEENRGRPTHELLETALRDAASGRVTWDSIKKLTKDGARDEEEKKDKK